LALLQENEEKIKILRNSLKGKTLNSTYKSGTSFSEVSQHNLNRLKSPERNPSKLKSPERVTEIKINDAEYEAIQLKKNLALSPISKRMNNIALSPVANRVDNRALSPLSKNVNNFEIESYKYSDKGAYENSLRKPIDILVTPHLQNNKNNKIDFNHSVAVKNTNKQLKQLETNKDVTSNIKNLLFKQFQPETNVDELSSKNRFNTNLIKRNSDMTLLKYSKPAVDSS
jgi:hypothetical protein